ncbi:MAG: hypothetical protein KY467_14845 [Gemmatimonadetes bacterium]|nr:hypothetical protein [Gemmatimonadota bacterium]
MSQPQTPPPSTPPPIPPPPGRPAGARRGCLRVGLIGCGVLLVLGIAAVVAIGVWWKRNRGDIEVEAAAAAREGARIGLASDEAACFEQAKQRAGGSVSMAGSFSVGAYTRSCLEFSRQTPGFCDGVPPQSALRRTLEWQSARCGDDVNCRSVGQVVQQYCTGGRVKRPAADTVRLQGEGGWWQDTARAAGPGVSIEPDSGTAGNRE